MVGADGSVPAIRIVWPGKRWSQAERELQQSSAEDDQTRHWRFSKTESGYVTREAFLDILSDLDEYLTEKSVTRPVILVMDG